MDAVGRQLWVEGVGEAVTATGALCGMSHAPADASGKRFGALPSFVLTPPEVPDDLEPHSELSLGGTMLPAEFDRTDDAPEPSPSWRAPTMHRVHPDFWDAPRNVNDMIGKNVVPHSTRAPLPPMPHTADADGAEAALAKLARIERARLNIGMWRRLKDAQLNYSNMGRNGTGGESRVLTPVPTRGNLGDLPLSEGQPQGQQIGVVRLDSASESTSSPGTSPHMSQGTRANSLGAGLTGVSSESLLLVPGSEAAGSSAPAAAPPENRRSSLPGLAPAARIVPAQPRRAVPMVPSTYLGRADLLGNDGVSGLRRGSLDSPSAGGYAMSVSSSTGYAPSDASSLGECLGARLSLASGMASAASDANDYGDAPSTADRLPAAGASAMYAAPQWRTSSTDSGSPSAGGYSTSDSSVTAGCMERDVPLASQTSPTALPSLVHPRPIVASRDGHEIPWNDDTSDSSESEVLQTPAHDNMQHLLLSHGQVLTNKQMRQRQRQRRRIPAELRDVDASRRRSSPPSLRRASPAHASGHNTPAQADAASVSARKDTPGPETPVRRETRDDHALLNPILPAAGASTASLPEREGPLLRPRIWRRRERRAWNAAPAAADQNPAELRSLSQEMRDELPSGVHLKPKKELVYDMLHENQRGIVHFGVSKRFSSHMLFAFDPSPWTDAAGVNTALDTSTMQLPDPSWEWVHPAWLIDMTGDTDEEGWQYSGSFTGLQIWNRPMHVNASRRGPIAWWQALCMRAQSHSQRRSEVRESKNASRPDEGLEAIVRSARARSLRWSGVPSVWTFVRRRRWVRLRQRISYEEVEEPDPMLQSLLPPADTVMHAKNRLFRLLPIFLMQPAQVRALLADEGPTICDTPVWSAHFTQMFAQESHVHNPFLSLAWVCMWLRRPDLQELFGPLAGDVTEKKALAQAAVVEYNFDSACLVMKLCPLDRLRLDMWCVWLGLSTSEQLVPGGESDTGGPVAAVQQEWHRWRTHLCGAPASNVFAPMVERTVRRRLYEYTRTNVSILDVWDLIAAHVRYSDASH